MVPIFIKLKLMTTAMAGTDLLRFFAATGHEPRWLDFPL